MATRGGTGDNDKSHELVFSPDAAKALAKIQPKVAQRIMDAMKAIAAKPFGHHPAAKALVGTKDSFRLRVGDWRALYRIERSARRVFVEDVLKRQDAYR